MLNAERTFWEKATILHQYAHLPEDKKLPLRISRHFYDFFRLLNSEIKEKTLIETSLLERVATHKSIYFASSWANYATARKETLRLSPSERIRKELEKDYVLMKSMFFREIPEWELILTTIEKFEKELGDSFIPVVCDVSRKSEIEKASKQISEQHMCPSHFFLNAGIAGEKVIENPKAFDLTIHEKIMAVNYFGVLAFVEFWEKPCQENGGANFIVTSSVNKNG